MAHLRTSFKNTFFLVFWRKNCFALDWRDYSVVWFRDTTRDFSFFFGVALFWTFFKNVFFRFFRQFFRSEFPDKRAGRNNGFACFFRGSCAATRSQPDVGNSRFLTILQRCWSWRCSNSCTFWHNLDANLGGARSQRSIGFSSFDTKKKHVRETPKNQTSTRQDAYPVPAGCRQEVSPEANLYPKPLIYRRVTCRAVARRGFPLATQHASREGSSEISRG